MNKEIKEDLYNEKYNWNIMEKRLINEYRKLDKGSDEIA